MKTQMTPDQMLASIGEIPQTQRTPSRERHYIVTAIWHAASMACDQQTADACRATFNRLYTFGRKRVSAQALVDQIVATRAAMQPPEPEPPAPATVQIENLTAGDFMAWVKTQAALLGKRAKIAYAGDMDGNVVEQWLRDVTGTYVTVSTMGSFSYNGHEYEMPNGWDTFLMLFCECGCRNDADGLTREFKAGEYVEVTSGQTLRALGYLKAETPLVIAPAVSSAEADMEEAACACADWQSVCTRQRRRDASWLEGKEVAWHNARSRVTSLVAQAEEACLAAAEEAPLSEKALEALLEDWITDGTVDSDEGADWEAVGRAYTNLGQQLLPLAG